MRTFLLLTVCLFLSTPFSGGQIKNLLKSVKGEDVVRFVKKETIRQLEKSRENYDPTDFNYAVSFSDNSGVFESEEKLRKYQKGILYTLSPESLENRSPEEKAEDYNDVGEVLYASGKFNSAEVSFLTARLIHEYNGLTESKTGALVIQNLGLLYHTTGRFGKAEIYTKQALEIQRDLLSDMDGYGASVNNLGVLYKDMGNFNEAETLLDLAIRLTKETKGSQSSSLAIVLNNKAILFQVLGKYEDAEKTLLQALDIAAGSLKEKSPNFVRMKVNLALLYQLQKRYDEAEKIYLEAIKIKKQRLGTNHPDYAVMLRNLASLYLEQGRPGEVEELLSRAVQIYKKKFGEQHPVYATSLTDLGRFYISTGNTQAGRPLITQAFSIQKTTLGEHHPSLTNTRETMAVLNWQEGHIETAAGDYKEVMDEYLYQIHTYFPPMSEYDKTKFWNLIYPKFIRYYNFVLDARELVPGLAADMYDYHISTKALLLNTTNRVKRLILEGNDPVLVEKYKEWVDLKKYLSEVYTLSKKEIHGDKINIDSLEDAANTIEKELSNASDIFSEGYLQKTATHEDIAALLTEKDACIEIIRIPSYNYMVPDTMVRYAALVMNKHSEIPEIVEFKNGYDMEGRHAESYRDAMQRGLEKTGFYEIYWDALGKLTSGFSNLYVSRDGIFNQINLNTLLQPSGSFIIDDKNIFYVMNTRDVVGIKSHQDRLLSGSKSALLIGNPNYASGFDWDEMKKMPLPELPGTGVEVEKISALLQSKAWKTEVYIRDEATEEQVKAVKDPYVLHIATHGYFLEDLKGGSEKVFGIEPDKALDNPLLRSGLLFKGADNTLQSLDTRVEGEKDDGILNAYESLFLDLGNTELVVLSACETGLGEVRNGEGVYGLQRAFQLAGVSSMIISLWQVSDKVTQMLMTEFYKSWLDTGDKYKAFKRAQEIIKIEYPAPFYWGAFIMINNP